MKFFDYFSIEENVLNVYKTLDFGDIPESDLYTLHVPAASENLMSISYKYYDNIDDWWLIYYFNKFTDITFAILPPTTIDSTITYYVDLFKNYDILDANSKLNIKECVIAYYLYIGMSYTDAIAEANANLNNSSFRTDPVTISELKDFLFMYIMQETTYSDPIKVPSMQVVFKMKAVMNQKEISWSV